MSGQPPPALTLRTTIIGGDRLKNDFGVYLEGRSIGRIRGAQERFGHNPGWDWKINPPLPIPTWATGQAESLEEAKAKFREAWERFHATLTPHDIEHWHHHQDAAARRSSRRGAAPDD
jgi:hypothetical protein